MYTDPVNCGDCGTRRHGNRRARDQFSAALTAKGITQQMNLISPADPFTSSQSVDLDEGALSDRDRAILDSARRRGDRELELRACRLFALGQEMARAALARSVSAAPLSH
jgi:hypothetical protein